MSTTQVKDIPAARVVRGGAGQFVPQRDICAGDAIQQGL